MPVPDDIATVTVLAVADDIAMVVGRIDARTPDLALVELLMRTQLAARRLGLRIRLLDAPEPLCALLELVGLADVLELDGRGSGRFEPQRQAELGEQLGVDEVMEGGDPPA